MAKCENENEIKDLTKIIADRILELPEGTQTTIALLAGEYYKSKGYEYIHLDLDHGHVWTRDGGKTYAIQDFDLMDVLEGVEKMLNGKATLVFEHSEDMKLIGLPYNFTFEIKRSC